MKKFNCPHCNATIAANQIPPDVGAAAVGATKSEAKARSSRENGKKSVAGRPVSRTKPVKPVHAAQVAEPLSIPAGNDEPWYGEAEEIIKSATGAELHKAAPAITTLAEAEESAIKSLTLAKARAAAIKLKPLVVNKVRDYSAAYQG